MVAGDEIFKSSMLAVPEDSPVKETERNSARESELSLDDKEDLAVARAVTLQGSFSSVSKRNFARKYALDSIFQALQDLHTFGPLQSQTFSKKSA